MSDNAPQISIVIPVYNEAASLSELYKRLTTTMETLGQSYEVILVDDGSTDGSFDILREQRSNDKRWRVARLSRNFGQTPAIYAGFSLARGAYVFMMDADLQMYPEDIPLLYEALEQGHDMVSGWRTERRDNPFRTIMSRLLNRYTKIATGFPLHDHGCSLKGFRRHLVEHMCAFSHRCRFMPVDAAMLGGRVTEVPVRHKERPHGHSKYNLFRLFRTGFDMITTATTMPLQMIMLVGMVFVALGGMMGVGVLVWLLAHGAWPLLGTLVALMFVMSGAQFMAIGLMCEYVGRIYIETQRKPFFIIQEELE